MVRVNSVQHVRPMPELGRRIIVLIMRIENADKASYVRNKVNKKKYPPKFQVYLNLCRTAMQVSHLNNIGFLPLTDKFFIPAIVIV